MPLDNKKEDISSQKRSIKQKKSPDKDDKNLDEKN
jgi:hypothetical protein